MESAPTYVHLCELCAQVNRFISTLPKDPSEGVATRITLIAPTQYCFFCDRVNEYLREIGYDRKHWLDATEDEQDYCKIIVRRSRLGNEDGLNSSIFLSKGDLEISLAIWADEGCTLWFEMHRYIITD